MVGLGPRGRDWVREVRAHDDFELTGCVDVDPTALAQTGAELEIPAPRSFTQLADALDAGSCDAVIVATGIDAHVGPCETALSRRRAVLVEKPFTLGIDEAARLVLLADESAVPLVVGQNYRYLRSTQAVRRIIRAGRLGRIGMIASRYYIPARKGWETAAGIENSVLWEQAIHHIDALSYVTDSQITGVTARSFDAPWGEPPRGASMHALMSLEDGINASYTATYESRGHEFFEAGQGYYQRFVGERATLHMLYRWLILCEQGKLPRVVRRGRRQITEEANLLGQLRNALLNDEEPDSSGRDNLHTIAAVEACARSATSGEWVDPGELVPLALDPDDPTSG